MAIVTYIGRDWVHVASEAGKLLATGRRTFRGDYQMRQAAGAWAGTVFYSPEDRLAELSALYAGVTR